MGLLEKMGQMPSSKAVEKKNPNSLQSLVQERADDTEINEVAEEIAKKDEEIAAAKPKERGIGHKDEKTIMIEEETHTEVASLLARKSEVDQDEVKALIAEVINDNHPE